MTFTRMAAKKDASDRFKAINLSPIFSARDEFIAYLSRGYGQNGF